MGRWEEKVVRGQDAIRREEDGAGGEEDEVWVAKPQ
jgi:hypothetical protein